MVLTRVSIVSRVKSLSGRSFVEISMFREIGKTRREINVAWVTQHRFLSLAPFIPPRGISVFSGQFCRHNNSRYQGDNPTWSSLNPATIPHKVARRSYIRIYVSPL